MKRPPDDFHEIDKFRLDREWARQPGMTRYYAEKLAKAKKRVTQAEAAFKVRKAELARKIRNRPDRYGLAKLTEGAITEVLDRKLYAANAKQYTEVVDAKYDVDMLQAAVETCRDRKKAIEDLVFLHSIGYFAECKTPKGMTTEDLENYRERNIKGIRAKNRKKRKD